MHSLFLAQARLAIVDLNGSWQPIQSEHNCVLIQNGEIYNHLDLREKLGKELGPLIWEGSSDTETLLACM